MDKWYNMVNRRINQGQRLEKAAELYENRDSFVDFSTGTRLTFKELKEQVYF